MFIKKIKTINFRSWENLCLLFNDNDKVNLFIGKNSSGKSNIILGIRKLLDYDYRISNKIEEKDSFNSNKKDIKIEIVFDLTEDFNDINKIKFINKLLKFIDTNTDSKLLFVKMLSIYNNEINEYETEIFFGNLDKFKYFYQKYNPLDETINSIFFDANFNFEKSFKSFMKAANNKFKKEGVNISQKLIEQISLLEKAIINDELIGRIPHNIKNKISSHNLNDIFEFEEFNLTSNFKKNIDILNKLELNKMYDNFNVANIGDGKERILTYIFKVLEKEQTFIEKKNTFIFIEEPENNLFFDLQLNFIESIYNTKPNQMFITTHSNLILNLLYTNKIIKIFKNNSFIMQSNDLLNEDISYLFNEQISRGLFYDKIILVEGKSELIFYEWIKNKNSKLKSLFKDVMIFEVGGINFFPYFKLLKKLGIEVVIKTDNDYSLEKSYFGYSRMIKYLEDEKRKKIIENKLNQIKINKEKKLSFDDIKIINNLFREEKIFFQNHHESFEKELKNSTNILEITKKINKKSWQKTKDLFLILDKLKLLVNDENNENELDNELLLPFIKGFKN